MKINNCDNIIINNIDGLEEKDINRKRNKVRAVIINKDKKILICRNNGVFLLPGGKLKNNEDKIKATVIPIKSAIKPTLKEYLIFLTPTEPKYNAKT